MNNIPNNIIAEVILLREWYKEQIKGIIPYSDDSFVCFIKHVLKKE